jgi:hypothetical protein
MRTDRAGTRRRSSRAGSDIRLRIPIDELDDRRLAQLGSVTAFAKSGFNPDEPRIPKGNPHGGEWTDGGDDEGGSGSSSGPTPDVGAGGPDGDGDGDGSGDDGSGSGSDGVPTPAPPADASDTPPQSTGGGASNSSPSAEPSIEYIIVEPQGSAPATASSPATDAAPATGAPTPLGSADLDGQITPAAIPAATGPTSGAGPEATSEPTPPEIPSVDAQPLDPQPQIPSHEPPTTEEVNTILRSTATWLGRAATLLGPLFSSNPRVRIVLAALNAARWISKYRPEITSYLDKPKTLRQLQQTVRAKPPGYETHHIVERLRRSSHPLANSKVFRGQINAPENLVSVPRWKHVDISAWYSRPNRLYGGLSPRDYLRGKSWEEQYEFGLRILRRFGVLE